MKNIEIKKIKFSWEAGLWIGLFVVIGFAFVALKNSYGTLSGSRTEIIDVTPNRSVRINFDSYDEAIRRVEGSVFYRPPAVIEENPFANPPKE